MKKIPEIIRAHLKIYNELGKRIEGPSILNPLARIISYFTVEQDQFDTLKYIFFEHRLEFETLQEDVAAALGVSFEDIRQYLLDRNRNFEDISFKKLESWAETKRKPIGTTTSRSRFSRPELTTIIQEYLNHCNRLQTLHENARVGLSQVLANRESIALHQFNLLVYIFLEKKHLFTALQEDIAAALDVSSEDIRQYLCGKQSNSQNVSFEELKNWSNEREFLVKNTTANTDTGNVSVATQEVPVDGGSDIRSGEDNGAGVQNAAQPSKSILEETDLCSKSLSSSQILGRSAGIGGLVGGGVLLTHFCGVSLLSNSALLSFFPILATLPAFIPPIIAVVSVLTVTPMVITALMLCLYTTFYVLKPLSNNSNKLFWKSSLHETQTSSGGLLRSVTSSTPS